MYLMHFMCVSVCTCVCTACAYVSIYIHTGIFHTYIHLDLGIGHKKCNRGNNRCVGDVLEIQMNTVYHSTDLCSLTWPAKCTRKLQDES